MAKLLRTFQIFFMTNRGDIKLSIAFHDKQVKGEKTKWNYFYGTGDRTDGSQIRRMEKKLSGPWKAKFSIAIIYDNGVEIKRYS